jgi:hypothetical protein
MNWPDRVDPKGYVFATTSAGSGGAGRDSSYHIARQRLVYANRMVSNQPKDVLNHEARSTPGLLGSWRNECSERLPLNPATV